MSIQVGVIGTGTVGSGTLEILLEKAEEWKQKLGLEITISWVCARSDEELALWKGLGLPVTTNVNDVLDCPDTQIIVELAGGYDLPLAWLKQAFTNGKHAVTANKALVAKHGPELFPVAAQNNCHFLFEAAVGGGIPIIRTLQEAMSGNTVKSISCIINGTCNYILTEMKNKGGKFEDILLAAQEMGYAEADPTFDVDGIDSAHKLAIMATMCSGSFVDFEKMHISGIREITVDDIRTAQDMDCTIKLLGIFNVTRSGRVDARVHPCIIPLSHQLAPVEGVLNAVYLETTHLGPHLQTGAGAGKEATASAVVADIVALAAKLQYGAPPADMSGFSRDKPAVLVPMDELETRYYFRFTTRDEKGVLAAITGLLSQHDISIQSMIQKSINNPGQVTIGVLSETAQEKNVLDALQKIDSHSWIVEPSRMLRFAS